MQINVIKQDKSNVFFIKNIGRIFLNTEIIADL